MLRRALAESMRRVKLMATEDTVDRRIVVKLLTTYFERDRSPEVLQLMSRMLGFTGPPRTLPAPVHLGAHVLPELWCW